jgi:hypothetical protein
MLRMTDLPEAPFVGCGDIVVSIVQMKDATKELGQISFRGVYCKAVFQSIAHVEEDSLCTCTGEVSMGNR